MEPISHPPAGQQQPTGPPIGAVPGQIPQEQQHPGPAAAPHGQPVPGNHNGVPQSNQDVIAAAALGMMPPPPAVVYAEPPPPPKFEALSGPTEQQAREALLHFVGKHCGYGKACASELVFTGLVTTGAIHYTLETFTEARTIQDKFDAYKGQMLDGPNNGPIPPLWSIPCPPSKPFHNHHMQLEVPHSSVAKNCYNCEGKGKTQCAQCVGKGHQKCRWCTGGTPSATCNTCGGDGKVRCIPCGNTGSLKCTFCDGYRQLRHYVGMTLTFKNHSSDFISQQTTLPSDLVRKATGDLIFDQTLPQVWPVSTFPVAEVNQHSARLVEEHRNSFLDSRKLAQHQSLHLVPITEASFSWKGKTGRFWVYGKERRVHAPDYPQKSCFGCSLM